MRKSQAFASHRHAVILELNKELQEHGIPEFNAEAADIRKIHEEDSKTTDVGEALADHQKRARTNDMLIRRKEYIDGLQTRLKMEMHTRVEEYKGTLIEEEKDGKKIYVAKFPDGSQARVPRGLWVDYKAFQAV